MDKLKILSMMFTKYLCAIKLKYQESKYKMSHETWVDVAVYNQNSLNQNLANKRNNTLFYAKIFFPKKNILPMTFISNERKEDRI
jgi:hypothetical protein